MTRERWAKIEEIFHLATECSPSQRSALLDRECGTDSELREEVESLLQQSEGSEDSVQRAFLKGAMEAIGPVLAPTEKKHHPWWMLVLVASFLITLVFISYLVFWGPSEIRGVSTTVINNAMRIDTLEPGSLLVKSGIRVGDRVLTIDNRPIRASSDWIAATGTWEVGRPHQWLVARGDERITIDVIPESASFRGRMAEGYWVYLGHLLSGLLLGFLIAWKRPSDPVARIGSLFLMTASMAFGFPQGWAAVWRELPVLAQLPLWITQISRFVLEGIFLSFFLVFPRRLFSSRWPWIVLWVPVLLTLPWRIAAFNGVIHPDEIVSVPVWILQAGFFRTIVYLLAGIGVLAVSYRRLLDPNEKRRVRAVMLGTAVSAVSATAMVVVDSFSSRNQTFAAALTLTILFPFNSTCFVSLAYAILRHRILDIRVIVRQGLQYALARGFVLTLIPALGVLLVVDLAVNSNEPLARIMQSRGWIYFVLAGAAFVIHRNRKRWLVSIDRRFFRERYDAHKLLGDVLQEIRLARSLDRVATRVVTQIEAALHPEFASIMVQEPRQQEFHVLALAPLSAGREAPAALSVESKLVGLARVLGKPVEILTTGSVWLERRLPQSEIDFFRQKRIDLVVPIEGASEGRQALLILGIKKSEEPYSSEDQELIQSIAGSLSLLLGQNASEKVRVTTFNECPKCGSCFDTTSATCVHEGAVLVAVQLPRTLSGRYRLERRRGRGGMGTVYEATDTALDRRVAVKVISDDLVGSAEAAERFQHEARASASFSHPNVVTVHDYGIEGSRAFLVMELLEGLTLREELVRSKILEPARVVQILRDACSAIDAAHRRKLIHRDVKPENIFLTPMGAKILDFGIAKFLPTHSGDAVTAIGAQTRTGFIVGTLAYMSPEQLMGESPDVGWDLWALAVVAYEALVGNLPFSNTSSVEWRRLVLEARFTPTQRWDDFFNYALAPDRATRPKSAAELIHSLEQVVSR